GRRQIHLAASSAQLGRRLAALGRRRIQADGWGFQWGAMTEETGRTHGRCGETARGLLGRPGGRLATGLLVHQFSKISAPPRAGSRSASRRPTVYGGAGENVGAGRRGERREGLRQAAEGSRGL